MKLFSRKSNETSAHRPFSSDQIAAFERAERAFEAGEPLSKALSDTGVEHRAFLVWRAMKADGDAVLKAARDLS